MATISARRPAMAAPIVSATFAAAPVIFCGEFQEFYPMKFRLLEFSLDIQEKAP
jgi:hypothetical protein